MESEGAAVGGDQTFRAAPSNEGHSANFIDAVRSGDRFDLNCDILEGHMSTVLPHLGNIAYRVGETLEFNGKMQVGLITVNEPFKLPIEFQGLSHPVGDVSEMWQYC